MKRMLFLEVVVDTDKSEPIHVLYEDIWDRLNRLNSRPVASMIVYDMDNDLTRMYGERIDKDRL